MEHYEMAERLRQKAGVSLERARAALEENDWDMLDAMIALEREKNAGPETVTVDAETDGGAYSEPAAPKPVKSQDGHKGTREGLDWVLRYIKRLLRLSVENDFVVLRRDKVLLAVPVLALAALLVCCFWFTLPLLVVGLFFGCSYHFEKNGRPADGQDQSP